MFLRFGIVHDFHHATSGQRRPFVATGTPAARAPADIQQVRVGMDEKLLRLASFLFLGLTLQLFLESLVPHQLIGALPNFCYIGFGRVEVPSQPGGYFHLHQLLSVPNGQSRSCDGQQMSQLRLSSSFLQNEQTVRKRALKLHLSRQRRRDRLIRSCSP